MKLHYYKSEDEGPKADQMIVVMVAAVQPATNANLAHKPDSDTHKLPICGGTRAYAESQCLVGTIDAIVATFRQQLEAAVHKYKYGD